MGDNVVYELEVSVNGKRNLFPYKNEIEVNEAFDYLLGEYNTKKIVNRGISQFRKDVVRLSILKTVERHDGSALYSPPLIFFEGVSEEIILSAKEYYERINNK